MTLCSTQTTMSARIKQPTGKKLNNGVKEGGVAGDKENKIIHSHHWEKLKQILNMQFQCYNFLIKLDQSRTKALKNRKGAKYSPWKSIYFTSRWKLCENLCHTTFCHIHRTGSKKSVNCAHQGDGWGFDHHKSVFLFFLNFTAPKTLRDIMALSQQHYGEEARL